MRTNHGTNEFGLFAIIPDDERASGAFVIQHSLGLEDLQIRITNILDGGDDPEFGHGGDFVDGTRERHVETTNGASRGVGVTTDGRKSKSEERERNHIEAKG